MTDILGWHTQLIETHGLDSSAATKAFTVKDDGAIPTVGRCVTLAAGHLADYLLASGETVDDAHRIAEVTIASRYLHHAAVMLSQMFEQDSNEQLPGKEEGARRHLAEKAGILTTQGLE
jgi:hypothetical protein